MLSSIAAIVTIVGSLFAAGSSLIERTRLRRELVGRRRTQRLVAERVEQSRAEGISVEDRDRLRKEAKALERTLHQASGRSANRSYEDVQLTVNMSATPASNMDALRQWVLLGSSAIGVILVAVDLSMTSGG